MNSEHSERYIVARANSLKHALRGVAVFVRVTPNFWVHFITLVALVALGFLFRLSTGEWALLVAANGAVFAAEAVNSAIEIDMDLTHPGPHGMVRDTKDMAAAAVLIAGVSAWIVDILVLIGHVHF